MKTTRTILFLLLTMNFSYGQQVFDQQFINRIDFGYSTRWDIEQMLGKGEMISNKIINPDYEQDLGKQGIVQYNGLSYKEIGVTFVCAEDGEKISSIQFRSPFRDSFGLNKPFQIGLTKIRDILPRIDTTKMTTSGASFYWSFQMNGYTFYVEKPNEHKNKIIYSDVPLFKDNLNYYNNQPIKIITIDKWNSENFNYDPIEKRLGIYEIKPIYAPKSEKHLNTYEMGWPKNLPWIIIPFYAMTGGAKLEKIKQGYWIEYSPNHIIAYEGEFKNNMRVGLFKYYDKNGNLERSKNYLYFPTILTLANIIFGLLIIWIVIRKIRKTKNAT